MEMEDQLWRLGHQIWEGEGRCFQHFICWVWKTDLPACPLLMATFQAGILSLGFTLLPKPPPPSLFVILWWPFSLWKAAYLLWLPLPPTLFPTLEERKRHIQGCQRGENIKQWMMLAFLPFQTQAQSYVKLAHIVLFKRSLLIGWIHLRKQKDWDFRTRWGMFNIDSLILLKSKQKGNFLLISIRIFCRWKGS